MRTALWWLVDMVSLGAAIGYGYTSAAAFKYAHEGHNGAIMFTKSFGRGVLYDPICNRYVKQIQREFWLFAQANWQNS